MINSFYALEALDTFRAFFIAISIGIGFGFSLERAGFGSSRKLSGIFYFKDMTVLKVMFTGLLTAMLGVNYCVALGFIEPSSIYFMSTIYLAQIVGGLIFGVGFVMGGWCPGTAAVGAASGKLDAFVFLGGAIIGSILFNSLFSPIKSLYSGGESGVLFIYNSLGISKATFSLLFTCIAVFCFWGAEYIEKKVSGKGEYFNSPFLKLFSFILILVAAGLFFVPSVNKSETGSKKIQVTEEQIFITPEKLAESLMDKNTKYLVLDVRSPKEYRKFHIRKAVNIPLEKLQTEIKVYALDKKIVLYSYDKMYPIQTYQNLKSLGYTNIVLLKHGLHGFILQCLKPASLREFPVSHRKRMRIKKWRNFFIRDAN